MSASLDNVAVRLCCTVTETPEFSNPAAKVGAWLVGVAARTGGFPLTLTYRQIQRGFTTNDGKRVEGTGCHNSSIRAALRALQESGMLTLEDGPHSSGQHNAIVVRV